MLVKLQNRKCLKSSRDCYKERVLSPSTRGILQCKYTYLVEYMMMSSVFIMSRVYNYVA